MAEEIDIACVNFVLSFLQIAHWHLVAWRWIACLKPQNFPEACCGGLKFAVTVLSKIEQAVPVSTLVIPVKVVPRCTNCSAVVIEIS